MNELQIFNNTEFGSIRTTLINDIPWFVGKDVADALGYSNTRDALAKRVDDEDKGVGKYDTLGGPQEFTIINESGLYSLVFSSRLPSAKRFKRWVTSEVLPAIRSKGYYSKEPELMTMYNSHPVVTIKEISDFHNLNFQDVYNSVVKALPYMMKGEDYYEVTAKEYEEACGIKYRGGTKSVGLLTREGYRIIARSLVYSGEQFNFINRYFCTGKPIVEIASPQQKVLASPQSFKTTLNADYNMVNRLVATLTGYVDTYNYYKNGGSLDLSNYRKQYGYGNVGAQILTTAAWYGSRDRGRKDLKDVRFKFKQPYIRKDGRITIPLVGSFTTADPIPENFKPKLAEVTVGLDECSIELRR